MARFRLELASHDDAFGDLPATEVCRILREAAEALEGGQLEGRIRDVNGNACGRWSLDSGD